MAGFSFLRPILVVVLLVIGISGAGNETEAASLWWDTSNGNGLQAGNGTWSILAADNNWNTSATPGGGGRVTWTQNSDAIFQTNGTSAVTVSGTVNVNSITFNGTGYTVGGTTLTLTGSNITTNVDGTINAPLGGTVGLTKLGTATLTLAGTNNYTGATSVNNGTILVNGSTASGSAVTVNSGGTLGGIGTVNGTVSVVSGGTVDAGPKGTARTAAAVGTLHTGALTLASGSTFHADAFGTTGAPTDWDQVIVAGTATLGGATFKLNIGSGLTFIAGTTYVMIDATAISGTFAGLTEGSTHTYDGYTFTVHYDAANGNFDLVAVPEPGTWMAGCISVLGLAFNQRRRLRGLVSSLP